MFPMKGWSCLAAAALTVGVPVSSEAQNEKELRDAFEGRMVVVKIDMPATQLGIDIHPDYEHPLDFRKYGNLLKQYGIGVQSGQQIMITKVKLKGDHIELQLGGGGFGTFADLLATSGAQGDVALELQRERQEDERKGGGSRFNVHYHDHVPAEAQTPAALIATLGEWVDFPADMLGEIEPAAEPVGDGAGQGEAVFLPIHKGMTEDDVNDALGPPMQRDVDDSSGMMVVQAVYELPGVMVQVRFVEDVLVNFKMEGGS